MRHARFCAGNDMQQKCHSGPDQRPSDNKHSRAFSGTWIAAFAAKTARPQLMPGTVGEQ